MNRSRMLIASGALTAAALLSGCGDDGTDADAIEAPGVSLSATGPADDATSEAASDAMGSTVADPRAEAEKEPRTEDEGLEPLGSASTEPVASKDFTVINAEARSIPLQVDVLGLERGPGDVVRLELRITNRHEDANWRANQTFSAGPEIDLSGVSLIDLGNDLRYLVLVDSEEKCVCSSVSATLGAGEHVDVHASFPAPPAEVAEVDVQLGSMGVIGSVPVSDR